MNIGYEYLLLTDGVKKKNGIEYKLKNETSCITNASRRWFIKMRIIDIIYKSYNYKKIYIKINELANDNLKYHFIMRNEQNIISILNNFKFNSKQICLTTNKLTFKFYYLTLDNELLELDINEIPIIDLEIKFEI